MKKEKKEQRARSLYKVVVTLLIIMLLLDFVPSFHPLLSGINAPAVLFIGLAFSFIFGTPYKAWNAKASKKLLQWSVIGLGFGMNLQAALASGAEGMSYTLVSVIGTLFVATFLGVVLLKMDKRTSYLIGAGTAICGGSAIAAVGPVIKADDEEMSVALGAVFVLNAIALFLFPYVGHLMNMSQHEFGTWAAIAIHDTSSVVGAGSAYGAEALRTSTMIKLTRALWIIPIAFASSYLFKNKGTKVSIPWFILWFVVAIFFNTYILSPYSPTIGNWINLIARKVLVLTMFFIGASLSRESLRHIGFRPFIMAVVLWGIVSITSLAFVMNVDA